MPAVPDGAAGSVLPAPVSAQNIDKLPSRVYYIHNFIDDQVPPGSDRNRRRIGNPVGIRNGTATVCVEAPRGAKASHWKKF